MMKYLSCHSVSEMKELKEKYLKKLEQAYKIESEHLIVDKLDSKTKNGFSDYDFARLFIAEMFACGQKTIDFDELGYKLMQLKNDDNNIIFNDLECRKTINGVFVDVYGSLQSAVLVGLLSKEPIENTNKREINLSPAGADIIINSYDEKYVEQMTLLVKTYIKTYIGEVKKIIKTT